MRDDLTVAREVNSDGIRRYLVWVSDGPNQSTFVRTFEAKNVEDAKRQARLEIQMVEQALLRL